MTDLATTFRGETFDLDLAAGGLATDEGLVTTVLLSLFSDARAREDDHIPDGSDDRRGWWGDAYPPTTAAQERQGDRFGSRLWVFAREKATEGTRQRIVEAVEEALRHLTEDGIAARVDIASEWIDRNSLGLLVTITRPDRRQIRVPFRMLWDGLARLSYGGSYAV